MWPSILKTAQGLNMFGHWSKLVNFPVVDQQLTQNLVAQLAGAEEYTDCISGER